MVELKAIVFDMQWICRLHRKYARRRTREPHFKVHAVPVQEANGSLDTSLDQAESKVHAVPLQEANGSRHTSVDQGKFKVHAFPLQEAKGRVDTSLDHGEWLLTASQSDTGEEELAFSQHVPDFEPGWSSLPHDAGDATLLEAENRLGWEGDGEGRHVVDHQTEPGSGAEGSHESGEAVRASDDSGAMEEGTAMQSSQSDGMHQAGLADDNAERGYAEGVLHEEGLSSVTPQVTGSMAAPDGSAPVQVELVKEGRWGDMTDGEPEEDLAGQGASGLASGDTPPATYGHAGGGSEAGFGLGMKEDTSNMGPYPHLDERPPAYKDDLPRTAKLSMPEGDSDWKIPAYYPQGWAPRHGGPIGGQPEGWTQSMINSCGDKPDHAHEDSPPVDYHAGSETWEGLPQLHFAHPDGNYGLPYTPGEVTEPPYGFYSDGPHQYRWHEPAYATHGGQLLDGPPGAVPRRGSWSMPSPEWQAGPPMQAYHNFPPYDPSTGAGGGNEPHYALSAPIAPRYPESHVAVHAPHNSRPNGQGCMGTQEGAPTPTLSPNAQPWHPNQYLCSGWVDKPQHPDTRAGDGAAYIPCPGDRDGETPSAGHYTFNSSLPLVTGGRGPEEGTSGMLGPFQVEQNARALPVLEGHTVPSLHKGSQNGRAAHEKAAYDSRHFTEGEDGDVYVQWDDASVPRIMCGICSMEGHR
jgi:hypothetical protein